MGRLSDVVRVRHTRKRIDRRFKLRSSSAKQKHISLWWIGICAVVVIGLFCLKTPQQKDAIAVLNGQPITVDNIEQYQRLRFLSPGEPQEVVEQYINEQLLLAEAERRGVVVSASETDTIIQEALAAQGATLEDLETTLQKQNLQMSDLRQRYREQLVITRLIDTLHTTPPTEEEIRQFYAQYPQSFAGKSLPEVQETIISLIQQQQRQEALPQLIRELRSRAEIKVYQ